MSRRKAEMVLEIVDRATRPFRRIIALQERLGKITEWANRASQRSARAAERATNLYRRAVSGLTRSQDALQRGIRRSNILIRRQITQLRTASGLIRSGAMGMGRTALLAGAMYTAYAGTVSLAGSAMLGPARQFERFEAILTTTEGSAAAAKSAMGWVQDFAVSTPYELDQVTAAFVQLRSYGLDPTNGLLRTLGDTSAAMGKDIGQAVEAIADAVTGENERLKEFGIKASKAGKYIEYAYSVDGVEKVAKAIATDRAAIEAALTGIFNERFGGAMERQAKTFDGMLSNIMDQWAKFQLLIMNAGVFDWMKSKLKFVIDELDRLSENGQLQKWAETIADHILRGLKAIWNFGASALQFWGFFQSKLATTADLLGGWRNLALSIAAIPLRGVLFGAALSMIQLATGAALAAKATAGIGFGALAKAALMVLNPLTWVRGAFIALRVAFLASGIGALVAGLAMAGVWIYNNWAGLMAFFKGFGEAFMEALGPARPLAERVIKSIRKLWDWIGRLVKPLDASAEQWRDWGRAAGEAVAGVFERIQRIIGNIRAWFKGEAKLDWSNLIPKIDWLTLAGGTFALVTLVKAITWTKKLVGGPIKWALLLGKLALSSLITPLVWTAALLPNFAPALAKFVGFRASAAAQMSGLATDVARSTTAMNRSISRINIKAMGAGLGLMFLLKNAPQPTDIAPIPESGTARENEIYNRKLETHERLNAQEDGLRKLPGLGHLMSGYDWMFKSVHGTLPPLAGGGAPVNYAALPERQLAAYQSVMRAKNAPELPLDRVNGLAARKEQLLSDIAEIETRLANLSGNDWQQKIDTSILTGQMAAYQTELKGVETDLKAATLETIELRNAVALLTDTPATVNIEVTQLERAVELATKLARSMQQVSNMNAAPNAGAEIQARASGGSFAPGWLLTGEAGPELKYTSQSGFIAHNRALRNMVAMSKAAARNIANANRDPHGGNSSEIVELSSARPRYIDNRRPPSDGSAPSININMVFNGRVDREALPDIRNMKDELVDEILDRLNEQGHANTRRGHG